MKQTPETGPEAKKTALPPFPAVSRSRSGRSTLLNVIGGIGVTGGRLVRASGTRREPGAHREIGRRLIHVALRDDTHEAVVGDHGEVLDPVEPWRFINNRACSTLSPGFTQIADLLIKSLISHRVLLESRDAAVHASFQSTIPCRYVEGDLAARVRRRVNPPDQATSA